MSWKAVQTVRLFAEFAEADRLTATGTKPLARIIHHEIPSAVMPQPNVDRKIWDRKI